MKKINLVFCVLLFAVFLQTQLKAQSPPPYQVVKTLSQHTAKVSWMITHPDGTLLATGAENGEVFLWKLPSGVLKKRLAGHRGKVTDLEFKGNELVSAAYDGTVSLWNTQTGSLVKTWNLPANGSYPNRNGNEPTFAAFTQDNALVFGGYNMKVFKADLNTGSMSELLDLSTERRAITCGRILATGELLLGSGGVYRLLKVSPLQEKAKFGDHNNRSALICEIAQGFSDDFWSYTVSGKLSYIKNNRTTVLGQVGPNNTSYPIKPLPSGQVLTSSPTGQAALWKVTGGSLAKVQELAGHSSQPVAFAATNTASQLFTSDEKSIKVWERTRPVPPPPADPTDEFTGLQPNNIVNLHLKFQRSRAILLDSAKLKLDKLADYMQRHPTFKISLEGHTDNVGNPHINKVLSQRRADAAKFYLVGKGIADSRIQTVGYGKERPIASNEHESTRKLNRRVEMRVISL
jgi:outer membrane protein OmpA-like peptidoglycan-associated protein